MTGLRVIVTGSRDWRGTASVWVPLTRLLERHGQVTVLNGKCPRGADELASRWVDEYRNEGASEIPFEADWDRHPGQAGFIRNGKMVAAGAHQVLAWANPCSRRRPWCPPGRHPSHGTADCVAKARAAGIPVYFCPQGMSW